MLLRWPLTVSAGACLRHLTSSRQRRGMVNWVPAKWRWCSAAIQWGRQVWLILLAGIPHAGRYDCSGFVCDPPMSHPFALTLSPSFLIFCCCCCCWRRRLFQRRSSVDNYRDLVLMMGAMRDHLWTALPTKDHLLTFRPADIFRELAIISVLDGSYAFSDEPNVYFEVSYG